MCRTPGFGARRWGRHAGVQLAGSNRGETKTFMHCMSRPSTPTEASIVLFLPHPDRFPRCSHSQISLHAPFGMCNLVFTISCVCLQMQRCRVTVPQRKFFFLISSKESVCLCVCVRVCVWGLGLKLVVAVPERGWWGGWPRSSMTSTDRTLSG